MTTNITVSLNINADPPVIVPSVTAIAPGEQSIVWIPDNPMNFTFDSLTILTVPNPIDGVTVADAEITAQDDNLSAGTYKYKIVVTAANGSKYSTEKTGIEAGDPGEPELENEDGTSAS